MSEYEYTTTVTICGEECDYDPVARVARIHCVHCGAPTDVEVELEDGHPVYMGHACDKCRLFCPARR